MTDDTHGEIKDERKSSREKHVKKRERQVRGVFERWMDHVAKMERWDELSHACLFFPYSCY